MRTGLWVSGAGGSGVLVGRLPDGSWSPPSGLMLHTAGLGFLIGVDIYDCIMVINTDAAMKAFSKLRCTVGGEVSAVAGPVGVGGVLESEVHRRQAPIFTYLKSRGFYAGVQIDGTILIERNDENERFYGQKLSVAEIMAGKVRHPPYELRMLMQTIKAAQGDNVDVKDLPTDASPSDFEIEKPFGIPDREDPDPYGVLALEKAGLEIREAGTKTRPSRESFIFNPSPTSPVYDAFNRNSSDVRSISQRSSWRTSALSSISTGTRTVDIATQTESDTPATSPRSIKSSEHNRMEEIHEDPIEQDVKATDTLKLFTEGFSQTNGTTDIAEILVVPDRETPTVDDNPQQVEAEPEYEDQEEPVVVHTIQQVQAVRHAASPKFVAKARLVTLQKKAAPALPPRNPIRDRKKPLVITGGNYHSEGTNDQGTSPISSTHRSSSDSIHEPGTDRSTSIDSVSSVEMGGQKSEGGEEEKEVSARVSGLEEESKFHSSTSTPVVLLPSEFETQNTIPGQFI